jgi:hypothetical protein
VPEVGGGDADLGRQDDLALAVSWTWWSSSNRRAAANSRSSRQRGIGRASCGMFEVLWDQSAGLPLAELRSRVWERVPPSDGEQADPSSYLGGWTTAFVKAEWIRKAHGRWWITADGKRAYGRYRHDPAQLTTEAVRLYHAAMSGGTQHASPRPPGSSARYVAHPQREERIASAIALARLVLDSPELIEPQRRRILSQAIWFVTEADGKYLTRYRSRGAREAQASGSVQDLRHDHVITRKALIDAMLAEPRHADEILRGAIACIVTVEEHARLTALGPHSAGWERYRAASIDVFDMLTDTPLISSGQVVG